MTTRILQLVALLTLLAAFASACGSSGSSGDGVASLDDSAAAEAEEPTEQASDDPEEAALAWARCMRGEGLDVPDPEVQDGRVIIRPGAGGGQALRQGNREKFQAAVEKCGTPLGDSGPPQISEEDRAQLQESLLAFAKCMRENGVDMPDPDLSGGGPFRMGGPGAGIDPDSPAFEKAREACQSILQDAGGRFGGGGPPLQGGQS